jgi:putative acetyltransferase
MLVEAHLEFCRSATPPEHVHAVEPSGLSSSTTSVFAARNQGIVVGIAALKTLFEDRVEIKCMHTRSEARGQGVGSAMLGHLLTVARERHSRWIGLETGTTAAFAPARSLYASFGFAPCAPFGDYLESSWSVCMSLSLTPGLER